MSYNQTFVGKYTFADAHCLEVGLDRFAAIDDSIVDLDALEIDGLDVVVDTDCSAPASMYESTQVALSELGDTAKSGGVDVTFELDGIQRDRCRAGGRKDSKGLPARHYRWDLFFAARAGDAARLRELQALGVALDQTFERYHRYSPLHLAAKAGSVDAVELLLAAGIAADIAPDDAGITPLALAANGAVAKALLAAGASPDRRIRDRSLLAHVAGSRRDDVVYALLEAGARPADEERVDIVGSCARTGSIGVLHALLTHDPKIAGVFREPEVMQRAIQGGEPVLVDLLLEHGATLPDDMLDRAIRSGATALVESALRASDAIARCGTSANHADAMCVAARDANLDMMKLLARHGIPTHPAAPGETSPLHAVAASYRPPAVDCLKWLVDEQGVPVDATTAAGKTAFRAAVEAGQGFLASMLVAKGADPTELFALPPEDREYAEHYMEAKWWRELTSRAERARSAAAASPSTKSAKPVAARSNGKATAKRDATAKSNGKATAKRDVTAKSNGKATAKRDVTAKSNGKATAKRDGAAKSNGKATAKRDVTAKANRKARAKPSRKARTRAATAR